MGLDQTNWKEMARLAMPECLKVIDEADNPYTMWMELFRLFKAAYEEPRNDSLIERIYKYAAWCEMQSEGETAADDLLTCVVVCFYEDIPKCEAAWDDIPNWFTKEEFTSMRGMFRYYFTDEEYARIEEGFEGRIFRSLALGRLE